MRLLLVEDQTMAADYIAGAAGERLCGRCRARWRGRFTLLLTNDYDLAILDVMLPGMNGWKIQLARQAGKLTPVMFHRP